MPFSSVIKCDLCSDLTIVILICYKSSIHAADLHMPTQIINLFILHKGNHQNEKFDT